MRTNDEPANELAHHARLPEPSRELFTELRGDEQHEEPRERANHGIRIGHGGASISAPC